MFDLIERINAGGWTLTSLGQDHPQGEFACTLIFNGEFYLGRGSTGTDAISDALMAQPYVPYIPPLHEPPSLLSLLPQRKVYRR